MGEESLDVVCSPMERCIRTALPLLGHGSGKRANQIHMGRAVCHALICEHGNNPSDFSPDRIAEAFPTFFGQSAVHELSFLGFTHDADTIVRATATAEWLRDETQARRWRSPVVAIFSHQTFLDCLLQILVDGTAQVWKY